MGNTPSVNVCEDTYYCNSSCQKGTRSKTLEDDLDPRSPSISRTPITLQSIFHQGVPANQRSLGKRFLKGFIYNLNDPRSPNPQLNRTPIAFNDMDKTLNLDDTFADLFIESRASHPTKSSNTTARESDDAMAVEEHELTMHSAIDNSSVEITSLAFEEETMACPAVWYHTIPDMVQLQEFPDMIELKQTRDREQLQHSEDMPQLEKTTDIIQLQETPDKVSVRQTSDIMELQEMPDNLALKQTPVILQLQQKIDPRSPPIGFERTPIIFIDDTEADEDEMLEDILATMSLNHSSTSSVSYYGTPKTVVSGNMVKITRLPKLLPLRSPKHLQRSHVGKDQQFQNIYEDGENMTQVTTPKKKSLKTDTPNSNKRTPLSCIRNRAVQLRSRSVQPPSKSMKARALCLTSYDDSTAAGEDTKIMHILQ